MDGLRISDAARATGFTVSALRFYEKEGVVVPERTATGLRGTSRRPIVGRRVLGNLAPDPSALGPKPPAWGGLARRDFPT